jgi:hypothetical protein
MRAHTPETPLVPAPLAVRAPALTAVLADGGSPGDPRIWAGRFADGWTSEELNVALPAISAAVGVELAVLWDYQDVWGFGGDSSLVAIDSSGQLREAPVGAGRYLTAGDVHLDDVDRTPGAVLDPHISVGDLPAAWGANLARVHAPDRELG